MPSILSRYFKLIVRYRVAVVVISILLSAVMAFQAKDLKVIIDADKILPPDHPYTVGAHKISDAFGLKYSLVIGVTPKSGDVYQEAVADAVKSITGQLAKTPDVIPGNILSFAARKAKSIQGESEGLTVRPLLPARPWSPEKLAAMRKAIEGTPLYRDALVSGDGRTAAIVAEYRPDPAGFRAIMANVEPILKPYRSHLDISVSGHVGILAATEKFSDRMAVLLPVAIVVIGILLYAAFGSWQALVLPLLTGVLALAISTGAMGMAGIPLDVFNAITPILILAVVTGHAVQLLKRYFDEYESQRRVQTGGLNQDNPLARHSGEGRNPARTNTPRSAQGEPLASFQGQPNRDDVPLARESFYRLDSGLHRNDAGIKTSHEAIVSSLTSMSPITLSAGLAAALGFFSLTIFDIQTVWIFGVLTGMGILVGLMLEFTFVPALRAMLPPPERVAQARLGKSLGNLARRFGRLGVNHPGFVLIVAALIAGLAVAGASHVLENNSNKNNIAASNEVRKQDAFLNRQFGGTNTIYLMLDGGQPDAVKTPEFMNLLDQLQREAKTFPQIGKTVSMASHVKRLYQAFNGGQPAFYVVPDKKETIAELLMLYSLSGDPSDFDMFVDQDYRRASVVIYSKSDSSVELTPLVERLKTVVGNKAELSIGGSVPEAVGLSDVMVHDKLLNIAQIIAVVFVVAALVFRSLAAGALVVLPVIFAVLVNFGVMGVAGIPLNIPTALCSAMSVGIGADYAIYLLYRAKQKTAQTLPQTIADAVGSAGAACLFVALAIALGYSVLMLSYDFYPHVWIGLMVGLAMLVSVLATLIVLPAALMKFQPSFVGVKNG
ncbi:MAG: hypothetical protein A3F73_07840 [Gallionellales bacterium RIFCSPLOWO2_12_FULL_59_22]|nr:MAG: hypothetical protein A3F73_07840 [Gallionellales bacterium RIFCSPLOWO2_12_FULL_59_22]